MPDRQSRVSYVLYIDDGPRWRFLACFRQRKHARRARALAMSFPANSECQYLIRKVEDGQCPLTLSRRLPGA